MQLINNAGEVKEFEIIWDNIQSSPKIILAQLGEKEGTEVVIKNAILFDKTELFRLMTYMYIKNEGEKI